VPENKSLHNAASFKQTCLQTLKEQIIDDVTVSLLSLLLIQQDNYIYLFSEG